MVVGVDGRFPAAHAGQHFIGAPGDHLVGVHVRLGARSGLPDDQRELVVEVASSHFGRGLLDRLGEVGVEPADARIHPRRRLFDEAQGMDDFQRHLLARAEREVADRPLGLRPPISVRLDLERPEAVGFGAGVGHGSSSSVRRHCGERQRRGNPGAAGLLRCARNDGATVTSSA
jgi:hypothetical protein